MTCLIPNYVMKLHGVSQWVDAQGDLKFIQNPIMREVQKFGEHEQASSHLFFSEIFKRTQIWIELKGPFDTPTVIHLQGLDITAVWFLIF